VKSAFRSHQFNIEESNRNILVRLDRKFEQSIQQASKEVKEKTQELKKEFNTGLKSVELLVDQINGK